ncbi:MAG TPA: DUF1996 domain-containing protein [Streptosporangiaceae bacterium]|nr:DUF1996 domain-containing protein [Streptosporangiaceae bacterium]
MGLFRSRFSLFRPRHRPVISAVAAVALIGGLSAASPAAKVARASGSGDFIVICTYNGNTAHEDPIDAPGDSNTTHLHDFFGNLASGGATAGGTQFPNMLSGDDGSANSMENNGYTTPSHGTNCQDSQDTAGYWVPTPFTGTNEQHPNGSCTTNCPSGTTDKYLYMRVYYLYNGSGAELEIPDGTTMITGFPSGCTTVVSGQPPPGCQNGTSYPVDTDIVQYSCGASTGNVEEPPSSAWPYNCNKYTDTDDAFSDGLIGRVIFPNCYDDQPTGNFPAPNSPVNTKGIATDLVHGYVAPWISYTTPAKYFGMPSRPANDFAYENPDGTCPQGFPKRVVTLEERLHLHASGAGWGEPSVFPDSPAAQGTQCAGSTGKLWNSLANGEMNNAQGSGTGDNDGSTGGVNDADATTQVAPGVWGPQKCVPASAPNGASTLSFACTPNADAAVCSTGTGGTAQPTGVTGCGTSTGTCYYGYEGSGTGWETLHADYWQTWQEGGGTDVAGEPQGTFPDIIEDCVTEMAGTCGFVTNSKPATIYATPGT